MIQRNGDVIIKMLPNVRQETIEPLIRDLTRNKFPAFGTCCRGRPLCLPGMQGRSQGFAPTAPVIRGKIFPVKFLKHSVLPGTLVYTDEYVIYHRLNDWGYKHESVNHGKGEYARDDDGDGFHEIHVNTMGGFWSLLRSWLRPHRGISQEKIPLYFGFFEFIYNACKRGKALLHSLLHLFVKKDPKIQHEPKFNDCNLVKGL